MFTWLRQLVTQPVSPPKSKTPEHLKLQVAQRDIPRYPPFMKGLPTHTPQELLETQADLLLALQQSCDASREEFEKFYRASIARFAAFAHLLPASQAHHHRGAGGLLRHSLEVGLWALREADKMPLIELTKMPGRKSIIVPRWQLTAFLAGLCHDIGKPMTDVLVRNHTATSHWKPVKESLWSWAQNNKVDAYFLEWQENRGKKHITFAAAMAKHVITDDELEWIGEGDNQLLGWMMETLNGTPSNTNPLYDIVIRADQKSVERDLKNMGAAMAGYDLGVPVERMLIDIMHSLVRQGIWTVNEPGAKVWAIDGLVFLVWPTAGQDIAAEVHRDSIPGVPRSPDAILDMLVERQLAFLNEGDFYKIAPAVLAAKIPDIKLSAVRLRDDTLVSKMPLANVGGVLLNVKKVNPAQGELQENAASAEITAEPTTNVSKPGTPEETKEASQQAAPATPATKTEKQSKSTKARSQPTAQQTEPHHNTATIETKQPQHEPASTTERVAAPLQAQAKTQTSAPVQALPTVQLDGALGEALKALANDLKHSTKHWGEHAVMQDDGQILLMWPAAFAGYGLAPKAIIEEFSQRNWCSADENFPTRKVVEVEMDGALVRVVRLHHDVSETIARLAGSSSKGTTSSLPPEPSAQKPPAPLEVPKQGPHEANPGKDGPDPKFAGGEAIEPAPKPAKQGINPDQNPQEQASRKSRHKKKRPAGEKPSQVSQPVELITMVKPRNEPTQQQALPTAEDVAARTLEIVMKALQNLPAQADENGWRSVAQKDALNAIKDAMGQPYTRGQLYSLAKMNKACLKVQGGAVLSKP